MYQYNYVELLHWLFADCMVCVGIVVNFHPTVCKTNLAFYCSFYTLSVLYYLIKIIILFLAGLLLYIF